MEVSVNVFRLSGRVTASPVWDHAIFGEAFYKTEVAAARLSGTEDKVPVTVSERLLPGCAELEVGSRVAIRGQIRSYNQRTETGSHLVITAFAREIEFPDDDCAPDENEAEIIGRICKPVVYRTTPFSREIADLLIAVGRRYGKSDYIPAIAWGRNARFAAELACGDTVLVRGRLQSREYQKTPPGGEPERRVAYELSCSSIERYEF